MEDTRAVQQSWKSFESDEVFTDKTLIAYYKLRLLEIKQKQKLLGQFTEDGKYVLSASIKKALVSLKKQIRFKSDDTLECLVTLKNIELAFTVQFWKTADKAVANLYFNESFSSDKQLKSFIAQYVASYDDTFFTRVKKVFNLFEDISELSYEQNDEIEKEYENMEQERKERELLLEIQSQYFILAMFETLQSSGERGQKILHSLKTLYDQEKEKPGNDLLYTKLREAFDKMVMETGGFNSLRDEIKEFDNNIKFYSKQIIGFDEANAKLKKYAETVNKEQKKSAGATSSKPKSSGAKYKPPKTVGPYKYTTAKAKKPDKPKGKAKDIMLGFKPSADASKVTFQKPIPTISQEQNVEQAKPDLNVGAPIKPIQQSKVANTEAKAESSDKLEKDDLSALAAAYFDSGDFNESLETTRETSSHKSEDRDIFLGARREVPSVENKSNTFNESFVNSTTVAKRTEVVQLER